MRDDQSVSGKGARNADQLRLRDKEAVLIGAYQLTLWPSEWAGSVWPMEIIVERFCHFDSTFDRVPPVLPGERFSQPCWPRSLIMKRHNFSAILGEISCLVSLALEFFTRFRGGSFSTPNRQ